MKKEIREIFIAEDGSRFDKEGACLSYEKITELEQYLLKSGNDFSHYSEMTPDEVAFRIADKFYYNFKQLKEIMEKQ